MTFAHPDTLPPQAYSWFDHANKLANPEIDPDDARLARRRIQRKFNPTEAAYLLRALGIEEES